MGRPRKTLAELQTLGVFRPDRHADRLHEPRFDGAPRKPRGLDSAASRLWDSVVPKLIERRIVSEVDGAILVSMVQLWSLYQSAVQLAAADPASKEVRGAVVGYWQAFDKAAAHCGLNPRDRAKLSVPPKQDDDDIEAFSRKRA